MSLVEILTAINLFCADPAGNKACSEQAWKCIDAIRAKSEKGSCPKSNNPNITFTVYCVPPPPPDFEDCFRYKPAKALGVLPADHSPDSATLKE